MEYDPASPTDEPEDAVGLESLDLSAIPLPEPPDPLPNANPDVIDIPLPSSDILTSEIPLPPPITTIEAEIVASIDVQPVSYIPPIESNIEPDHSSGPLKFTLKPVKQVTGSDSNEQSGVFESSKDAKTDEPRALPKLQAMMKRSKPHQLPVGVLPAKNKVPATETKGELFLPSKDSEQNGNSLQLDGLMSGEASSNSGISNQTNDLLSNAVREVNAMSSLAQLAAGGVSVGSDPSNISAQSINLSSMQHSIVVTTSANQIPNLMSISVQPVPVTTLTTNTLATEASALIRQPKLNMANMQYVNPQKLRSAQMIATPLIANPAIAAQAHHHDEQSKGKDSRRRSRSRSRRDSRSGRRSSSERRHRRRHSSSSSSSSPRRDSRRYQRRSRSRHSSRDRLPRNRKYDRERDSREWRSDRRSEYDSRRNFRPDRNSGHNGEKRANPRRSPASNDRRYRRRSSSRDRSKRTEVSRRTPENKTDRSKRDVNRNDNSINRTRRDSEKKRSMEERCSPRKRDRSKDKIPQEPVRKSIKKETIGPRKQIIRKRHDSSGSDTDSSSSSASSASSRGDAPQMKEQIKSEIHTCADKHGQTSRSRESSSSSSSSHSTQESTHEPEVDTNHDPPPRDPIQKERIISPPVNSDIGSLDRRINSRVSPLPDCRSSPKDVGDSMELASDTESVSLPINPDNVDSLSVEHIDQEAPEVSDVTSLDHRSSLFPSPKGTTENSSSIVSHCPSVSQTSETSNTVSPGAVATSAFGSDTQVDSNQTCESKYDLRSRKTKGSDAIHDQLRLLLDVVRTDLQRYSAHSTAAFDAFPEAPKPEYAHIITNDYKCVQYEHSESLPNDCCTAKLLGSAGSALSNISNREMRRWVCDCTMPSLEDLGSGFLACGYGCINRALNIECGSSCPVAEFCSNRQFRERLYAPTEPFYSGPGKGWGLRTTASIKKDTFIIEYVGEVIDFIEFKRRVRRYEKSGHAHHYFMSLESDRFLDAGSKGNWARFVNHSCEPNCETQKWSVNGEIRIGFFARQDIPVGEEITIDYQFVQFGVSEQKCYCGTPSCSGIMGSTNKNFQEKVRLKDTSMVERRVMQLLKQDSFEIAKDITLLLQVMVQECLTRYTRLELLKRLSMTQSTACLKLFRQYNGLDMLAALMCDADSDDWELKRQILVCLEHIPVSEQKQVQSTSRLMDIVSQWCVDPHFCRPRVFSFEPILSATEQVTGPDAGETDGIQVDAMHESPELYLDGTESSSQTPAAALNVLNSPSSTPTSTFSSLSTHTTTRSSSLAPAEHQQPNIIQDGTAVDSFVCLTSVDGDNIITQSSPTTPISGPTTPVDIDLDSIPMPDDEKDLIEEIRRLASLLVESWSALPEANYRIPRVERQETEQELHVTSSSTSSLISWGHNEDTSNLFGSWIQSVKTNNSFPNARPNRDPRLKRSSSTAATPETKANKFSNRLSKSERRKLFEAQVVAAEEMKKKEEGNITVDSSLPSEDISNETTKIRQLLLCLLITEANKLCCTTGGSSVTDDQLVILFNTLLRALPHLISGLSELNDLNRIKELCESLHTGVSSESIIPDLPTGWKSAVDSDGGLYYYNLDLQVAQSAPPPVDHTNLIMTETPVSREKLEKDFTDQVGHYIIRLLRPYRLPNCLTGRIESNCDLMHLARKLTHGIVYKELRLAKHSRHPPTLTETFKERIKSSLTKYMTTRGAVYKRRQGLTCPSSTVTTNPSQPT